MKNAHLHVGGRALALHLSRHIRQTEKADMCICTLAVVHWRCISADMEGRQRRQSTGAASQQTYKADREGRHVHLHVGGRALALHQYPSACAFDESQCCRYVLFDFLVLTRAAVAGEGRGRGHGAAGRVRLLGCRDAGALDRRSSIFVCVYM